MIALGLTRGQSLQSETVRQYIQGGISRYYETSSLHGVFRARHATFNLLNLGTVALPALT